MAFSEKTIDANANDAANAPQPRGRDAVDAILIFLNLLELDAKRLAELQLREPAKLPPALNSAPNGDIVFRRLSVHAAPRYNQKSMRRTMTRQVIIVNRSCVVNDLLRHYFLNEQSFMPSAFPQTGLSDNMDDALSPGEMLKQLRLSYRGRGKRGLTQKELAAMAGIANPETVSKIERGAQSMTPGQVIVFAKIFNALPAVFVKDIPDIGGERGFSEEAEPFLPDAGSFESRIPLQETQSWYRIRDSRLDEIGIMPGDAVVIDIGKGAMTAVTIGDVVIANLYSADGKSAETVVRQWIPPRLLITNSRSRNLLPLNLETDRVSLLGAIVWPRRNPKPAIMPFLR
jgi:transcriptional regulator with XRE-family HTH domain